MGLLKVDDTISDLEYRAAKLSFLKERYPDLKLKTDKRNHWTYGSKIVNKNFNKFSFVGSIYGYYAHVRFVVFDEIVFEFKNKKEKLIIESIPTSCNFASLVSDASEDQNRQFIPYEKRNWHIEFSKITFRHKDEDMRKQVEEQALLTALDFAKKHPFAKVDYDLSKGLNPRLEKLLTFS